MLKISTKKDIGFKCQIQHGLQRDEHNNNGG